MVIIKTPMRISGLLGASKPTIPANESCCICSKIVNPSSAAGASAASSAAGSSAAGSSATGSSAAGSATVGSSTAGSSAAGCAVGAGAPQAERTSIQNAVINSEANLTLLIFLSFNLVIFKRPGISKFRRFPSITSLLRRKISIKVLFNFLAGGSYQ